jgi:integrase
MRWPLDLHNLANRVIRPALQKANTPWPGWHGFRRGLATVLYELGIEPKTRQAILRHADVTVTERHYVQPVTEVSTAAMAKFQDVLEAKKRQRAKNQKAQQRRSRRRRQGVLRTSVRTFKRPD